MPVPGSNVPEERLLALPDFSDRINLSIFQTGNESERRFVDLSI